VANSRKAFAGQYQGLLDPAVLKTKQNAEEQFLRSIDASRDKDGALRKAYEQAVRRVADVQQTYRTFEREHALLETGHAFGSELFAIARHIVRLTAELPKPNADRLREYRESNLESLKFQLYSPAPIYPELERVKLYTSLTFLAEQLGGELPLVVTAL